MRQSSFSFVLPVKVMTVASSLASLRVSGARCSTMVSVCVAGHPPARVTTTFLAITPPSFATVSKVAV
jgi:hypothetical protein